MKMRYRVLSGMLVTMAVGASMVGAQADTSGNGMNGAAMQASTNWDFRIDELKLIDDGDYNAWKQYMIGSGRQMIADKVTVDEFNQMAQLYDALKAGDYTKAKELAKGLKMPGGLGLGLGRHGRMRMNITNQPFFKTLSQDVQNQLLAAQAAGDRAKIRQILQDNNIKPLKGKYKDQNADTEAAEGN